MDDPLSVGIRLLLYASLGGAFGLAAFGRHALPAGERPGWVRSIRPLLGAAVALAVLASAGALVVLASRMLGVPLAAVDGGSVAMLLELPGLGPALGLRLAALLLALAAMVAAPARPGIVTAALAAALGTLAWSGHAAATDGSLGWLHLVSTILHLWGAGLWLGAIAAFLLLAGRATREPGLRTLLAGALTRFHATGTVIVVLLLASGLANLAMIVGFAGLAGALWTPWGQLMALKLAAFAAMLGLAALNRFRLAPGLTLPGSSTTKVASSLRLELSLAFLILALVAWLGLLSPNGD